MQQLRATPTIPPMTEQASVREVLTTYSGAQHEDRKLSLGALELAGETEEDADLVKKHLFQGHVIDRVKLLDELGDVLWYSMLICHTLDFSLQDMMRSTGEQLWRRYPNGFEAERSLNRCVASRSRKEAIWTGLSCLIARYP